MHKTTHNAAREAVQAKPCPKFGDSALLPTLASMVRSAMDGSEEVRTVLGAYKALAVTLAPAADRHGVTGEQLGNLLAVFNDSLKARLDAVASQLAQFREALKGRAGGAAADALAFDACDQMEALRSLLSAYRAMGALFIFSDGMSGHDLAAGMYLLNDAMAAQLDAMDSSLDALQGAAESIGGETPGDTP